MVEGVLLEKKRFSAIQEVITILPCWFQLYLASRLLICTLTSSRVFHCDCLYTVIAPFCVSHRPRIATYRDVPVLNPIALLDHKTPKISPATIHHNIASHNGLR